ncbi:AraC family transcriptional regulator [Paenibacillus apiarius]|uniref:AraC family transcriptional regulator n=1 Tax=Paenibacillus apiarius TaxID=46240 RepID=A0ABT4DXK5_9BACL|nr:AraC family transcriptional regulator [Paenibacillus apiarius]MCY9512869.1 AraC family transcriptional regulator [Paenibacillus apiarius]MCY9522082.1 AraC family transcriptional regulator [Paenibacillus apiarius]MCY9554099.1 AraC family transcriptional regulator [Paenibacillus apiarius]MCY9558842.1 AraC family transcriptional regulator [Paenibacillus apiarius]MCY9683889.1 AraC family transcriptional regulator [Paenibacillus apiarius]
MTRSIDDLNLNNSKPDAVDEPTRIALPKDETYSVASNPMLIEREGIHVLFSGESQTPPFHKLGPKLYDYYLLHHIMDGYGTFITETQSYPLGPGDAFLIAPNELVSYASDAHAPWEYRWIAFKGERAEPLVRAAGFTPQRPVVSAGLQCEAPQWMDRIRHAFHERRAAADLVAHGCLHLIMADYADHQRSAGEDVRLRPESEIQQTVRQMIQMMSTQYAHPLSIEQIADSLGYSRAYLSRIFKRVTEMTPVTFLLKLRIDKGRQLLRERPNLTIEQIAASVGIPDALYFSRQFRRFYGQSPTFYRSSTLQPDQADARSK